MDIELIYVILAFIFGLLIGMVVTWSIVIRSLKKESSGVVRIDHSDKFEEPYLFLELKPESKLELFDENGPGFITFQVVRKDYILSKDA